MRNNVSIHSIYIPAFEFLIIILGNSVFFWKIYLFNKETEETEEEEREILELISMSVSNSIV